jgi:quinol monooxygenase YgiN
MKKTPLILTAAVMLFLASSCGNKKNEPAETTATDTVASADTTAKAPAEPAFTPFKVMAITHKVKNFDTFKGVYMAHDSMRLANGLTHFRMGRGLDDSNMVFVTNIISDVQKAKDFAASANLKEAMKRAGVAGPPTIAYAEIIRLDSSKIESNIRVRVTHRVKDFDAWLKVYDDEGKQKRAENGLIDRAISRGIDDPNTVTIIFAISDMEKAKARMNSPELKATMMNAGVESAPTFFFYRLVD